jgi:hypothetical protein
MRLQTFGLHKMLGNYQVATLLVASRVVLSSIELVSWLVIPFILLSKTQHIVNVYGNTDVDIIDFVDRYCSTDNFFALLVP